ncbi:saccharopine dehydrogenase NADP-binding domain-containing protein [Sporosarcina sp. 179-K 3D1 HS]|uniref:saccharopine dehydrogenase family protein n=1 Tax=Sporosarcina sp. 179-K 3D1 HS TaxID=3232169 RepID=UPI00399FFACE
MRIVILGGAGAMGSTAVKDLALNDTFDEIVVGDINIDLARRLAESVNSAKVSALQVDVTDADSLNQILKGATIVLNFVGPYYKFAPPIIRACMEAKVHYVDICDDYDAAKIILDMDQEVKEAGITVLTGMGTSPGITNILTRMGMDELDVTKEVDTIWVMGEPEVGSAILYHFFHSCSGLVPGFDKGEHTLIQPLSEQNAMEVDFPEPLGNVKVYDIGHPEPITIPHFYPDVERVTNKGAVLPEKVFDVFRKLVDLGFDSTKPIEFNGTTISPRDFIVRYLQENKELLAFDEPLGLGGLRVIVKGVKDGKELSYVYTTVSSETTAESVAIPAVVGAELIAKGKVESLGVIAPEVLHPIDVFKGLGNRKKISHDSVNSGLIVQKIMSDGKIETIRAGRPILV